MVVNKLIYFLKDRIIEYLYRWSLASSLQEPALDKQKAPSNKAINMMTSLSENMASRTYGAFLTRSSV